jgi:crotonobetainyl-CoA:carnitine CoA-transferase CaiB-like acyl-CoA transferase
LIRPQKIGTPAADLLAGMDLALATMAALMQARDQQGHAIDISMVDSMTRFMTPRLISYLGSENCLVVMERKKV